MKTNQTFVVFLVGLKPFEKISNLIKYYLKDRNEKIVFLEYDTIDYKLVESVAKQKPDIIVFDGNNIQNIDGKNIEKMSEISSPKKLLKVSFLERLEPALIQKNIQVGINLVYEKSLNEEHYKDLADNTFFFSKGTAIRQMGLYAPAKLNASVPLKMPIYLVSVKEKTSTFESLMNIKPTEKIDVKSDFLDRYKISLGNDLKNITNEVRSFRSVMQFDLDNQLLTNKDLEDLKKDLIDDVNKIASRKKMTEIRKKKFLADSLKKKAMELKESKVVELKNWYKLYKNDMSQKHKKKLLIIGSDKYNYRVSLELQDKYELKYMTHLSSINNPVLNYSFFDYIIFNMESSRTEDDKLKIDKAYTINGPKSFITLVNERLKVFKKGNRKTRFVVCNNKFCDISGIKMELEQPNLDIMNFPNHEVNELLINKVIEFDTRLEEKVKEEKNKTNPVPKDLKMKDRFKPHMSTVKTFDEEIVFDVNSEHTNASFYSNIKISIMTEKEVIIESTRELPHDIPLKIDYPIKNIYFTIIHDKQLERGNKTNSTKLYRGQINAVKEETLRQLREFIIHYENFADEEAS